MTLHKKWKIYSQIRISGRTDLSNRERPPLLIGPTVDVLKAFCWKIRCPPKLKTFPMVISDRMYSSEEECTSEGDARGYLLCKMWSQRGIDKPCVF